ncbi:MAG: hypothetical protein BWY57_00881 [Betaproteobacteria bacterium ADurb.Bin341]|nr:MAG: hypothetical protein BWY57_00881 [Betaproteobacteria bacterium ADurb.Bin341]
MFTKATLGFLDELAAHNERAWFETHKTQYETLVRAPALDFIAAMAPALQAFAPHFRADPRKMGGSLMRVYRDIRFSRNKTPYKTNIGIQFRHELAKDVHAPGFYVHIATDGCLLAVGCWHPEADALGKIRDLVAQQPEQWFAARDAKPFVDHWQLDGERLKRPPRGYDVMHPAIEDIKRKDFVAVTPLSFNEVIGPGLVKLASQRFADTAPLMKFLCAALGVTY